MRDILGDDWPDQSSTRERRAAFIEQEMARLEKPHDPLAETPSQIQRRQEEAERSAAFWRQHEYRPLSDRLGIHSLDRRLQHDDPALVPGRPAFSAGDDPEARDD